MNLYKHQKIACQYLRTYPTFGLFMEQGCGKTLPILKVALERIRKGQISDFLVVAPLATMGAWTRDLQHFEPDEAKLIESAMVVINYESVWRKKEYDKEWDCIVLDESHKIKNRTAKTSKFLLKLSLKSKYRYILTGTPIGNGRLEDIWSQMAFLDPIKGNRTINSEAFGSYYDFTDRYCYMNKYYTPYAYKNVDEVQEIINKKSYRVTKLEALDLPEKLPDEIYEIEPAEKKVYKELIQGGLIEHNLLIDSPLTRLGKLRQLCSGFLMNGDDLLEFKNNKIGVLKDYLSDYVSTNKIVIFAQFKYSIKQISELCLTMKIKHVILNGDQKDKNIWKEFQKDESIRIIICNYASASQGVDLYASDTIIYYEPTLSSTLLEQSRDRIHRIGQKNKCSYIHFITKGTVEQAIYKSLSKYQDCSEKMFKEYIDSYQKGIKYK